MRAWLQVNKVSRSYGSVKALDHISFTAEQGSVTALLGRNGAGKSTLMNILTGYLSMSGGEVILGGKNITEDPVAARRQIGYLPETPPLYADMTVEEYLRYCARLKRLPSSGIRKEVWRVLEVTGLSDHAGRLTGHLSKGYRQRTGLAQALIGDPPLLILDEPGSGLDPMQMIGMRELIRTAGKEKTVLLSSHILGEVTGICSRALVLNQGRLCFDGPMGHLIGNRNVLLVSIRSSFDPAPLLSGLEGVVRLERKGGDNTRYDYRLFCAPDADVRENVFRMCAARDAVLLEMVQEMGTLEDAFVKLTGNGEETR